MRFRGPGIGLRMSPGVSGSGSRYWASLLTTIGYNHPMLPGLTINKVAGKFAITSHDIDDFRASYPTPTVKYLNWSTGNDSNDGNSAETAYKTLGKLNGVTYNRAYIAAGNYASANSTNVFTLSREVFGTGGVATLMRGATGENLTWTDDGGGMFHCTYTSAPLNCYDDLYEDAEGDPSKLTNVANDTLVAATPGSWYRNSGTNTLYVHLTDARQPDNHFYLNTAHIVVVAGKQNYAENIRILGVSCTNTTATANIFALKNCEILFGGSAHGIEFNGNVQSWMEDCLVAKTWNGDGISYGVGGAYSASGVEINITTRNNGLAAVGTINGTTAHENSIILRMYGNHTYSIGPTVHDIDNVVSLNIGLMAGYSLSAVASYKSAYAVAADASGDTTTMYLFECTAVDSANTYGAENREPTTSKIYAHNCTISNLKAGTVLVPF